jgi:hypothetical protein
MDGGQDNSCLLQSVYGNLKGIVALKRPSCVPAQPTADATWYNFSTARIWWGGIPLMGRGIILKSSATRTVVRPHKYGIGDGVGFGEAETFVLMKEIRVTTYTYVCA